VKTIAVLVFFFLIHGVSFAKECKLDKKILYSILMNEGLPNKIGYEYIISFNNKSDLTRVKKSKLKPYFVNSNVIDCKNAYMCEVILSKLNNAGIKNLDLGAFQINYKVHRMAKKDYFNLESSYKYACGYIENMIAKHGYNWYAIASYHSQTPHFNNIYRNKLIKKYQKVSAKID
jgi:hypothetical protein